MNIIVRVATVTVALASLSIAGISHAKIFTIDDVLTGSSGFGASLFHSASGSNPMSGATLAQITNSTVTGSYNDVTGDFSVTLGVDTGGTFSLIGTGILFDGSGTLTSNSQLSLTFTSPTGALQNNEIGFLPGYVCCGSTDQDPNSFIVDGGSKVMTLWGANFGGGTFSGDYVTHDLGMDLRLSMTEIPAVPVPAAAWLFGSGLIGLVAVARRKS